MPTATWQTGQTSAAGGGGGYGTATWQTAAGYNPGTGALVCCFVFGITNGASEITGGALSSTSVATGTNPTFSQHAAGWVTASSMGTTYTPFASMFYASNIAACTGLRFTFDATDSIYQWFAAIVEYSSGTYDTTNPFGRWGSDVGNGDTADSESTDLDQNTGFGNVAANSHVVGLIVMDASGGAIAPGSGWTERYEGPSGSGQTACQVQDDQDPTDNTIEWGAITPTVYGWATLAVEVRHTASTPASLILPPPRIRRALMRKA